jgi:anti-sigma B factor antagonist
VELNCHLGSVGDRPVLAVEGEVDLATIPQLRDQLVRCINRNRGATVYVDLDGVSVLDDTGLGVLLGAAGTARTAAGDLVLICSSAGLLARFAITGLDRAITVLGRLAP